MYGGDEGACDGMAGWRFSSFSCFLFLKKAFAEVVGVLFIACQACYHLVDTSDSLTHQGGGSL